ncbi:MAG TPA: C4-dicarboxylate ABC transporter substrate-binding protein, partial [Clostridiales bacterium]|nr:C4-dicarboxylate ABC transporter substrate-binding protein [Clostridiales bacterium]
MNKKRIAALLSVVLVLAMVLSACGGSAPAPTTAAPTTSGAETTAGEPELDRSQYFITVATGPTSGLYYPIGGAFSSVFQNKLGYRSSAQSTGASGENINLILTGGAELAIAMSDAVAQAYDAFGAFEGKEPATEL